jgi:hypothetical protein
VGSVWGWEREGTRVGDEEMVDLYLNYLHLGALLNKNKNNACLYYLQEFLLIFLFCYFSKKIIW